MGNILDKASQYVSDLFSEKLPRDMYYHSPAHTQEVAGNAIEIGKNSGLSDEEIEIVVLAAWFHDTGFTITYYGHEEASISIAEEFLKENNYPEDKIKKVSDAISVTKITSVPNTLVEHVLRDSDLHYLGTKDFFNKYELLRKEWGKVLNKVYTEIEWLELNIDFFFNHKFYTDYAKGKLSEQKEANLLKLKEILRLNHFSNKVKEYQQ
jgi:predicted metal-dependent HD superfamily phosphohydrolase